MVDRKAMLRALTRTWQPVESVMRGLMDGGMSRAAARAAVRYFERTGQLDTRALGQEVKWRQPPPTVKVRVDRSQKKVAAEDHTSAIRALLHSGVKVVVEDDGQQIVYRVTAQLVDVVRQ